MDPAPAYAANLDVHGVRAGQQLHVIGGFHSNKHRVLEMTEKWACVDSQAECPPSFWCGGVVFQSKIWVMGGKVGEGISASVSPRCRGRRLGDGSSLREPTVAHSHMVNRITSPPAYARI